MSMITGVTDRIKGVNYDIADLNRVGNNVQYLTETLISYGYSVTTVPKTDWTKGDLFWEDALEVYRQNVENLKAAYYGTTPLPSTMSDIEHTDANNIEKLLAELEEYIRRMVAGFRKSGTFKSGQGGIL